MLKSKASPESTEKAKSDKALPSGEAVREDSESDFLCFDATDELDEPGDAEERDSAFAFFITDLLSSRNIRAS